MNITHDNDVNHRQQTAIEDKAKLFDKFISIVRAYNMDKASLLETDLRLFELYEEAAMYGFAQTAKKNEENVDILKKNLEL